jgi:hypothetical protein
MSPKYSRILKLFFCPLWHGKQKFNKNWWPEPSHRRQKGRPKKGRMMCRPGGTKEGRDLVLLVVGSYLTHSPSNVVCMQIVRSNRNSRSRTCSPIWLSFSCRWYQPTYIMIKYWCNTSTHPHLLSTLPPPPHIFWLFVKEDSKKNPKP